MTPERRKQLLENLFEMWFELLKRSCSQGEHSEKQLESEIRILERSRGTLLENFIAEYHLPEPSILDDVLLDCECGCPTGFIRSIPDFDECGVENEK